MTAAIFGLLGVVVGGVLNGLVSAWLQRRSQRSDARAGSRLVRSELVFFLAAAERAGSTRPDELPQVRRATTELWQSNRSILARSLTNEQWAIVARAYAHIDAMLSVMVFEADGTLAEWRSREAQRSFELMLEPVSEALRALDEAKAESTRESDGSGEFPEDESESDDDDRWDGGIPPWRMPA